jgi:putative NADH-flavin reductase
MNLLVVGANGKTGRVLVHEPTQAIHCARILHGDARDPQLLELAIAGQNAIIDTIGTRQPFLKTTLETDAARLLIGGMRRHGLRRIVAISSVGVGDSIANVPVLYRALMPIFFRGAIPDKEGMEAQLRQSDLDWTIVRPAGLTDGPRTNSVRIITPVSGRHVRRIARADVADFILNHLTDTDLYRETVGIATQ